MLSRLSPAPRTAPVRLVLPAAFRGLVFALAVFAWFAFAAWIRPLALPDEGRYVGVAWELLGGEHGAVPTLAGLPFFHKPPLFYAMSAAAMASFGANEWAARMPSMLAATAITLALHAFAMRWSSRAQARTATLVLATMPYCWSGAQFANPDMLVAGLIGLSVLAGAHAVLMAGEDRADRGAVRRAVIAAWGFAALGVLAKGLIGVVLPGAVLLAWLLVSRRSRLALTLVSPLGIAVFLMVGLPWFVAMQQAYPGFFDYFIVRQHFQRFAGAGFNNTQPAWFYLPVLAGLALPWSLALPTAWRAWRRDASREHRAGGPPPVALLMACWLAVVVGFFSLPASKLIGYVLPALPPLAWLLARPLAGDPAGSRMARHVPRLAVLAVSASLAAAVVVAGQHRHSARDLGLVLRAQRSAGEPVLMVGRYVYDLPFYARLESPAHVLDDWRAGDIASHDNWKRELADAAAFDPTRGARTLVGREALPALLCGAPRTWVVGSDAALAAVPALAASAEVMRSPELTLRSLPRPTSCGT